MKHAIVFIVTLFFSIVCRAAEPPSPALQLFHSDAALLSAPHYEFTTVAAPREPNIRAIFFDALPWRHQPTRVFAYLGIPPHADSEKLPAIVLVHGGGGTAFADWVKLWMDRGYAAIAIDTCGNIPSHLANSKDWKRSEDPGPPGWDSAFSQIHDDPTDQWPYQAVADIMLANSLLRSLPEVDADRVGLTGISWGGYLTCLAAAADPRFKFAVPVYGCGYLDECVWKPQLDQMAEQDRKTWLDEWDPRHFVGEITMPMLWVDSTNDKSYPLGPLQKTFLLQQSPRTLSLNLRMKHGHPPGQTPEVIHVFADSFCKSASPLAVINYAGADKNPFWTIAAQNKIAKAELLYTKDSGPWDTRLWEVTDARLSNGGASATVPQGATAYFLNAIDERGVNVSSPYLER